jgi:Ran-binding protein 3
VSDTGESASSPQSLVKLTKIEKPTTGEEAETTLAEARAHLYEFEKSNGWKERGVGIIKINTDQTKYRLLMRTETTLRVILNASLYPEMKVEEQNKNQIRFACVNAIISEDSALKISNFVIKFQTKQVFEDFFKAFKSAKSAALPLKKVSPTKETPHTTTDESKPYENSEVKDKPETKLDEEKAKDEN